MDSLSLILVFLGLIYTVRQTSIYIKPETRVAFQKRFNYDHRRSDLNETASSNSSCNDFPANLKL
jgi:hypothetical protein